LGMGPHRDSSDTMDEPEKYNQGLAPRKTSGNIVVFGECGFICCESTQDLIDTGLHVLHALESVEFISVHK